MQAVFFSLYLVAKRGSWSQAFLAKTVETGHENLEDVLKEHVECVSKIKLKHTDPHRARVYKNASRFFVFVFGRHFFVFGRYGPRRS